MKTGILFDFDEIYCAFCRASLELNNDWPTHCARKLNWRSVNPCGEPSTFYANDPEPKNKLIVCANIYVKAGLEAEQRPELQTVNKAIQEDAIIGACRLLGTPDPDGMPNKIDDRDRRVVKLAFEKLLDDVDVE